MNTGVWLLRPSARVHADLIAYTTGRLVRGFNEGARQRFPAGSEAAKHFFASYFGTPRWFARLPERFNCCDKSILPSRACSRAPSSATAACARGRAGEAAGHTPRAHISFTGQAASNRTNRRCGMLRPAGQRTRSDCSGRRSAVEVHVSWTNAPETQKRALRHWHHNYEHVLKMLELPTVCQRKEKAATVAARTSLPRRAR